MQETNRQKKVAGVLQKDLADVLQTALRESGNGNVIISVSKVGVTTDLGVAKVYVSIFPSSNADALLKELIQAAPQIRHEIAQRTRHQLRRMPELSFFIDDTLDYMEGINRGLKGEDDPVKDPSLLDKRKKQ